MQNTHDVERQFREESSRRKVVKEYEYVDRTKDIGIGKQRMILDHRSSFKGTQGY